VGNSGSGQLFTSERHKSISEHVSIPRAALLTWNQRVFIASLESRVQWFIRASRADVKNL
jgi:hypothetical protein